MAKKSNKSNKSAQSSRSSSQSSLAGSQSSGSEQPPSSVPMEVPPAANTTAPPADMKPLQKSPSKVYGQPAVAGTESLCKICSKHVYHMEQIKAAKGVFHKACFRCTECSKPLSLDTYSSHEARIYCKPHFKQIFQPQPVFTNGDNGLPEPTLNGNESVPATPTEVRAPERKKYDLIIAENQPLELPADVVRSSTKTEDSFDSIHLDLCNIRNRFEQGNASSIHETPDKPVSKKPLTRAESIHKIMQRYQNSLSGEQTMSDEEVPAVSASGDASGPDSMTFTGLSSLKSQWENGNVSQKSESHRVNDELEEIRAKAKAAEPLKSAYERALQEKQTDVRPAAEVESGGVHASGMKEKFEKGQFEPETEEDRMERMRKEREEEMNEIARSETCTKEARNKFKQIEAGSLSLPAQHAAPAEDVSISSQELQNRFAYFENLKENPQKATNKAAGQDQVDDCPKVDTTKKMLDRFKALESGQGVDGDEPAREQRTRKITPPREFANERKVFESEPVPEDPNIVKSSYKSEEKIEVEPAKAKNLRAKFENWSSEIKSENRKHADEEEEFVPANGASKNLRAMFEQSGKPDDDKAADKPRPRINRFVEPNPKNGVAAGDMCEVCSKRIYAMERMEISGMKVHKACYRCSKCNCMLRLDNFTIHAAALYCIPHFKQLFMEKGNYEEGFGLEQHKDKWSNKANGHSAAAVAAVSDVEALTSSPPASPPPPAESEPSHAEPEATQPELVEVVAECTQLEPSEELIPESTLPQVQVVPESTLPEVEVVPESVASAAADCGDVVAEAIAEPADHSIDSHSA